MDLEIEDADLKEAARLNRILARAPRFKIRHRLDTLVIQSLLLASQAGSDARMKRAGLSVETRIVQAQGSQAVVRVLRPPMPVRGVVLDIHGGGWAIGNARMNDKLNAELAHACDVIVVSVDYRLAGGASIDALMEDCLTAALWLLEDGLEAFTDLPVIMIGESAGGHLAAATLLQLRSRPDLLRRVAGAVLYYGVYDLSGSASVRGAGPDTLILDGPGMLTAMRLLTPQLDDPARRQAPLSPLYGDLAGLPPALMFVGALDPLLDDTVQMAERWRQQADVELHLAPHSPHGFIRFRSAIARKALARSHAWISDRLAQGGARNI